MCICDWRGLSGWRCVGPSSHISLLRFQVLPLPPTVLSSQIIKREFQSYSTQIQIGTCFVLACFKVYSATMATMLAVFVPQTCPPTPAEPYSHLCTIQENFFGISTFNKIVLGVNFFCFASFIVCELVLFRREVWCG